jgi:hypothetical protein
MVSFTLWPLYFLLTVVKEAGCGSERHGEAKYLLSMPVPQLSHLHLMPLRKLGSTFSTMNVVLQNLSNYFKLFD